MKIEFKLVKVRYAGLDADMIEVAEMQKVLNEAGAQGYEFVAILENCIILQKKSDK